MNVIRFAPVISEAMIESMDVFDAFRTGEELFADRHPREAARVLRKVVEAEPGNGAGWELLGRAHFAAAQLSPAETAFRRLVEIEPTSAWAQTALALSLDRQSRRDEAAVHHRLAAAMGASQHDASRVELLDQ